jgi:hypothetical protein
MAYEDLLKDTSESKDDGNYFLVTITDLDLSTQYPIQFRWKKKNGTLDSLKYNRGGNGHLTKAQKKLYMAIDGELEYAISLGKRKSGYPIM